jgi:hypothetical protein
MHETSTLDLLSTIGETVSAAAVAAVVSFSLSTSLRQRARAAFAIGLWFLIVITLGATGALGPHSAAGVPGLGAAVAVPLAALVCAFLVIRSTREAMSAIPVWVLIAVNSVRILGVSFLLLYAEHRLPAPFALVAGWGDIFVGLSAAPVAWLLVRRGTKAHRWVLAWNLIGFLDLFAAITLGATSSPGPIRLFMEPPGSSIMTTLPWIIIPCFIVPSLEALHIAIFHRLLSGHEKSSRVRESATSPAVAGTGRLRQDGGEIRAWHPTGASGGGSN